MLGRQSRLPRGFAKGSDEKVDQAAQLERQVLACWIYAMDAELDGAKLRQQLDESTLSEICADQEIRLQNDALVSECGGPARIAVVGVDA